jgi:tetratricopeptide (TPR) repeat protein
MIGTRLRHLRTAKGLTQKELAAPTYSAAYVSTIEAGRRVPSRRALEHFASKLGMDAEELATGKPPDLEARLAVELQDARIALSEGRLEQADGALRNVARRAKRYGLRWIQGKAEEARGLWLERSERPDEALEQFQRAEELLQPLGPAARVDAVAGKARNFLALGEVRYAIHLLESLLGEIEREDLSDPAALARLHASLVDAYLDAGLHERAVGSASELERLAPRLVDPLRIAQMNLHVAHLYLVQGHVDQALRSLQRSEDAYAQLNLRTETAYAQLARGYVLSREGRLRDAREQLEQAITVFEATADDKDLARTLNELARVERLEGDLERATTLLARSIAVIGESDMPILAWAHRELGLTLLEQDPPAAEKELGHAIDLFERSGQPGELATTYRVLGDLLKARGQLEASCDAYRTGIIAVEAEALI